MIENEIYFVNFPPNAQGPRSIFDNVSSGWKLKKIDSAIIAVKNGNILVFRNIIINFLTLYLFL